MLIKTHLAITLFGILILISSVENKVIFVLVAILATYLADIDSKYSTIGKYKVLRPLQFFIQHRGITHSFSFLILVTIFLALFFPVIALGFFLGYGLHLFADSFTPEGIKPFYPLRKVSKGKIKTGSRTETIVFVFFVIADLGLILRNFMKLF